MFSNFVRMCFIPALEDPMYWSVNDDIMTHGRLLSGGADQPSTSISSFYTKYPPRSAGELLNLHRPNGT